jgi:hypothetical protein
MDGDVKGIEHGAPLSPPEAGPESSTTSATSAPASASGAAKQSYPASAALPTQLDPTGVRFDFNLGARVVLPNRTEGKWRVRLRDLNTGNILFESENRGAFVASSKHYFVRFGIAVWELDDAGVAKEVLTHEYDASDRDVLIQFPVGTLGDILAWFPYAARFGEDHRCRLCDVRPDHPAAARHLSRHPLRYA